MRHEPWIGALAHEICCVSLHTKCDADIARLGAENIIMRETLNHIASLDGLLNDPPTRRGIHAINAAQEALNRINDRR